MKTIVIENGVLARLAAMPSLVAKLPILSTMTKRTRTSCRPCDKKLPSLDFDNIRRALISLPTGSLNEIKKALGADKIRVVVKNKAGTGITEVVR